MSGRGAARLDLLCGERSEHAQQVGDALVVPHPPVLGEPLELGLDLGEHLRVEQLAQLGPAEELGEQSLVEGECGGATLGDGGVALVHERRDVAEQERLCERRRTLGVHVDETQATVGDAPVQVHQRRQVVEILQDLADCLENDRERRVAGGDGEELRRSAGVAATGAPADRGRGAAAAKPAQRTPGSGMRTVPIRRPRW